VLTVDTDGDLVTLDVGGACWSLTPDATAELAGHLALAAVAARGVTG